MNKINTSKLKDMKKSGEKIVMLTCYDYSTAQILQEQEIDIILIGDSLGMVKLGYENTLPVTVDDICYHTKAVRRGSRESFIIADMPFLSYGVNPNESVLNAGRMLKEGGANAVKVEGAEEITDSIRAMIDAKIPVMGHVGLTPQAINKIGGYKVQGKDIGDAKKLIESAKMLEALGVFALVLECIPSELSREITSALSIPTIGIGAGPHCDGQVLVTDDMLGMFGDFKPKFVKRYANIRPVISDSVKKFKEEVKNKKYPTEEFSY